MKGLRVNATNNHNGNNINSTYDVQKGNEMNNNNSTFLREYDEVLYGDLRNDKSEDSKFIRSLATHRRAIIKSNGSLSYYSEYVELSTTTVNYATFSPIRVRINVSYSGEQLVETVIRIAGKMLFVFHNDVVRIFVDPIRRSYVTQWADQDNGSLEYIRFEHV